MSDYVDVHALSEVLLAAALGGIGLVVLFALGLRGVSIAEEGNTGAGAGLAVVSFALVAAGVVFGIYTLLAA